MLIPLLAFLVPDGTIPYNVGEDGIQKVWRVAVLLNLDNQSAVWKYLQRTVNYTSEFYTVCVP